MTAATTEAVAASSLSGFQLVPSLEPCLQLVKCGSVRPSITGPTVIINFQEPEAIEIETAIQGMLLGDMQDYGLKPNSAPYKAVVLADPIVVGDAWDGSRWMERPSHVTVVPFHEFKLLSDEQKSKLQTIEIDIVVAKNDVFWTRGSPHNAAAGCKGVFYANLVLSPETERQIEEAREEVGLPRRPPPCAYFAHVNDSDERLKEFRFHKSVTSVVPQFVESVDAFASLDKEEAQSEMTAMAERISKWSSEFRIVKREDRTGNILVRKAAAA